MTTYRVSTHPDGKKQWWLPEEEVPDWHIRVRDATPEEAVLMDKFLGQQKDPRTLDGGLCLRLGSLLKETW